MSEQSFDTSEFKAGQCREWNQSAPGWKQYWDIWEMGAQHINERLVELAQIKPGQKVVDIASGIGEPAFTVARQVGPLVRSLEPTLPERGSRLPVKERKYWASIRWNFEKWMPRSRIFQTDASMPSYVDLP